MAQFANTPGSGPTGSPAMEGGRERSGTTGELAGSPLVLGEARVEEEGLEGFDLDAGRQEEDGLVMRKRKTFGAVEGGGEGGAVKVTEAEIRRGGGEIGGGLDGETLVLEDSAAVAEEKEKRE